MLLIKNLTVSVEDRNIINSCDLTVKNGTIHVLMGPNGSGKSTLAHTLAGHPNCMISSGKIIFNTEDVTECAPHERARRGIFLSFQHPVSLPGVTVSRFLHESYRALVDTTCSFDVFHDQLKEALAYLDLDSCFINRYLNDGFSGGEKKKFELLQLLLFKPKLAILDEIDSGLDIDALKLVTRVVQDVRQQNPDMSIIIITHYQRILEHIMPDYVHIFHTGTIIQTGDVHLIALLEQQGYAAFSGPSS